MTIINLDSELEEENATLQAEYERLRSQQSPSMSFSFSSSPDDATPIPHHGTSASGNPTSDVERDMLAEARLLRQHKTRLEARMKILEEHNRQLETQLNRLRQLLDEVFVFLPSFSFKDDAKEPYFFKSAAGR